MQDTYKRGSSLIEVLILIGVFSIISLSFYEGFTLGIQHVAQAKSRLVATSLATERMELLRSISYDDITTSQISSDEHLTVQGRSFHRVTSIAYFDDPLDGLGVADSKSIPSDYKVITVRVSWGGESDEEQIVLGSAFVPSGLETNVVGSGVLSVNVIDGFGQAVSGASVRVQNSTTSPTVDVLGITPSSGNVTWPGMPASNQQYQITVTKSGYESVATLAPFPTTAYYPTNTHMTVGTNAFSTGVMVTSPLSSMSIRAKNPLENPVPNVSFDLIGGRVLGHTATGDLVYNYNDSLSTNGASESSIEDVSPGIYSVSLSDPDYVLWKMEYSGGENKRDQIELEQGTDLSVDMVILEKSFPSYFVQVVDSATGSPLEGVSVSLKNTTLSYDVQETTDRFGYTYFPQEAGDVLTEGATYDLSVQMSGYDTFEDTVTINGLTLDTVNIQE